jgi:hypothetical protein
VFRTSRPQVEEFCERVCKQRSIEGILAGAEATEGLLFIVCWRGPIGSGLRRGVLLEAPFAVPVTERIQ